MPPQQILSILGVGCGVLGVVKSEEKKKKKAGYKRDKLEKLD